MEQEILELLNQADPKDFTECLRENLSRPRSHYQMLKKIKEETTSWKTLTPGCRAAAEVYFALVESN